MSPSWRSEIRVLLQPQRASLRRLARGLAPRLLGPRSEPVAAGPGWQPAVDALGALLTAQPVAGSALRVLLSSHYVRYALLPPSELLVTAADWDSFARHNFARVHGAAAEGWQVTVDRNGGTAALACGFDSGLLAALRERAAAAKVKLVAVEPALMAAYNEVRGQLPAEPCRLLVIEPGIATVARIGDAGWLRLRAVRTASGDGGADGEPEGGDESSTLRAALSALLERERLLDELPLERELAAWVPLGVAAGALPASADDRVCECAWSLPEAETAADAAAAPARVAA